MSSPFGDSTAFRTPFIAACLFIAALAGPAAAAEVAPDTPGKTPQANALPAKAIPEGRYLFRFAWNGIPSAESEVVVRLEDDGDRPHYLFDGEARTSKVVDIFWKFRASMTAVMEVLSSRTKKIRISERENRRFKETETIFDYESEEAYYTRWKKGNVKKKTIDLGGGIIDIASLGLMVCQQPLETGDSAAFTVLFKDSRYALEYRVISRERIKAAGKEYDALRVEPRFHKIGNEKKTRKVKQMTVWLTESEPHLPLRMRSRTFIGHVTGELARVAPIEAEEENAASRR